MNPCRSCCVAVLVMVVFGGGRMARASEHVTAAPNQLTAAEKRDGWRLLFDGKTTAGWRTYQCDTIGAGWKVIDGALTRAAQDAGDLITVDQFGAFELVLDFKISPEGNSGVMYHVTETERSAPETGPEAQILDLPEGAEGERTGWLYALYKAEADATRPAGQWNQMRLTITPEKCAHYINGTKYFEYIKGSPDWNRRVAASKFAAFNKFGKATRGHICFQDYGDEVAFRNIKIKVFSPAGVGSISTDE